jgi:hypothetical protein
MELGYIFLVFVIAQPVTAYLVMRQLKEMQQNTLAFMKSTQTVGGQPVSLIEKAREISSLQAKEAAERQAYISEEMRARAVRTLG